LVTKFGVLIIGMVAGQTQHGFPLTVYIRDPL
jgi:hypothetical protein